MGDYFYFVLLLSYYYYPMCSLEVFMKIEGKDLGFESHAKTTLTKELVLPMLLFSH